MADPQSMGERRRLPRIKVSVIAVVIAIVVLVSLVFLKPAMPDHIMLLTGPQGSAYHDLGVRYAAELGKRGLRAELILTDGGLDNLERLAAGAHDTVAFAPTTLDAQFESDGGDSALVALGSVDFEPLWLFYRSDLEVARIPDLANHVVGTGGEGTVGHHVATLMIDYNGIAEDVRIRSLTLSDVDSALDGIESREIDAFFISGRARSPMVAALLATEGVSFLSFERSAAYAARIRGIATVVVPEGVLDLSRNVPEKPSTLLSAFTGLVALDSLHPSIAPLLLSAASSIEQGTNFLSTKTEFPNSENLSLPLDASAKRYFDRGERGLAKFLPYKITRYLNHLGFVVLPLLTLVVVLLKAVPLALGIYGSLRLTGLLKRLESIEKRNAAGVGRAILLADLDGVDEASAKMFVPRSTVHDYIDFRQFLHDMRERVQRER